MSAADVKERLSLGPRTMTPPHFTGTITYPTSIRQDVRLVRAVVDYRHFKARVHAGAIQDHTYESNIIGRF